MAHESKIEWTEATWNPWHGCHKVSPGCKNCYMFRDKARYGQDPNAVVRSKTKFYDPLKWTEPRTIFTCSWSDFFIEEADPWRDEAFAIMALTPQHTYQVLTKRPERMLEYFAERDGEPFNVATARIMSVIFRVLSAIKGGVKIWERLVAEGHFVEMEPEVFWFKQWPLPNVWLGVSVEDQKTADERIQLLLQTPAAVRWLSIEPLLGPINLEHIAHDHWAYGQVDCLSGYLQGAQPDEMYDYDADPSGWTRNPPEMWERGPFGIDWVVAGGESGPDARPMHPDWVRSIRDQCTAANVPFFFKQWGEYAWSRSPITLADASPFCEKVGKKKAGRILDGRTWDEMLEVSR